MPSGEAIEVESRVIEKLSERLYRVEAPNGHQVLAHVPVRKVASVGMIGEGDVVRIEMTPFDMSTGRIISKKMVQD